jgi:phospholipid-translocating ATPase
MKLGVSDYFQLIRFFILIKIILKRLGIVFKGDVTVKETKEVIRIVEFKGRTRKWEILETLEFDSTRKRMSVILRDKETQRIVLYCKGAESFIIKKCINGDFQQTLSTIERFGEKGWRTLALAYKDMSEAEFMAAKDLLNSAYNDIIDRNTRISAAFDEIESGLTLIGSTAVEDKLQEDVALTLETIRRAGIKVWVLTGDKKETAINISNSCKHFSSAMEHLVITDLKSGAEIEKRLNLFRQQMPKDLGSSSQTRSFALIIDGGTLGILFHENFDEAFREICMKCDAVLCCRMSPAQKAQVVRLVKASKSKPMTCAIGDGANDVSMIQEAHVGLGIYGKEGRNAALSADFAFAKFKYVKRILLVHGYLYYTRSANLVQYFFYKNLAFVICQFYYAFFNAFSVSSLYDSIVLTMYNIFFTSAPIFLFGLCEQKVSISEIEANPYLYL